MGTGLQRALNFCLAACLLPGLLPGLEIPEPKEVEHIQIQVTGVAGGSVTLDCGSTPPSFFVWGYARPGTNSSRAVAYNYGQGPKVQQPQGILGEMRVPSNTSSSLVIDRLQPAAEGLYTCQALYDTPGGPKVTVHCVQLHVLEDGEPGSAHV